MLIDIISANSRFVLAFSKQDKTAKDSAHSSTQAVDSTNESILHHIRQKGPMVSEIL